MQPSAPALADADHALIMPGIYDPGYIAALHDVLVRHRINAVISLNDLELPILAAARADLEKTGARVIVPRSEEHTSELQSLMRISYAVSCLKNKTIHQILTTHLYTLIIVINVAMSH